MPEWATELRAHQVDSIAEAVQAFKDGAEVVFIDAPTGSGKTLIGQRIAAELDLNALYICTDKQLQAQFSKDFPYAKVIKGRNNYPTQFGGRDITADDCTASGPDDECMWCDGQWSCPYQVAKAQAKQAHMAVLNTSYFLTVANFTGDFTKNELVIVDEADALEDALMSFVEFTVPEYIGRELRLAWPIKGARKPTLIKWLNATGDKAINHVRAQADKMEPKAKRRWIGFADDCKRVAGELQRDVDAAARAKAAGEDDDSDTDEHGRWLRDYDTKTFTLKPVMVSTYGAKNLWKHSKRWLIMSATIISADEMVDSLGIPFDWEVVTVPMTFPVENRPIIAAPIADVTYKNMDRAVAQLAYAIERITEQHPGERVLVHTVSYGLNNKLIDELTINGFGRPIVTYRGAKEREAALQRYLATPGAVMLSPSMERGVDLPGDACRVVVVAKVPFPAMGDKRVSARMHLPGGQQWFNVQAVRDIVQMTGRGVRSATDHATTYILDAQFTKNVYAKNKGLFPRWWRDAVDMGADTRFLSAPRARSIQ